MVRVILALGALALGAAIYWALGADPRPLGDILADMSSRPWTVVTLVDLYLGFAIAAIIILLAERSLIVGLIWAAPVFFLGNIWTAAWLIVRLPTLARRLRAHE